MCTSESPILESAFAKVLVHCRMSWTNGSGCHKWSSCRISVPREWRPPCTPFLLGATTWEILLPAAGVPFLWIHLRSIPMAQLEKPISLPTSGKHHWLLLCFPWSLWSHSSISSRMWSRETALWIQTQVLQRIHCGDATGVSMTLKTGRLGRLKKNSQEQHVK